MGTTPSSAIEIASPESLREMAALEYESALDQFRHYSSLRRQDMAFVTTVQAAVFTVIGPDGLHLDARGWLLSSIAALVLLLGLNSERRLSAYMESCMTRGREIEKRWGMALLCGSRAGLGRRKTLLSNSVVFPLYYALFVVVWLIIWVRALLVSLFLEIDDSAQGAQPGALSGHLAVPLSPTAVGRHTTQAPGSLQ